MRTAEGPTRRASAAPQTTVRSALAGIRTPNLLIRALEIRRRWRSTLEIALLIGVVGALVLATVAAPAAVRRH